MSKLDNILSWKPIGVAGLAVTELGTRIVRQLSEFQDDALHPNNYIDLTRKSSALNTPIGDRYIRIYVPTSVLRGVSEGIPTARPDLLNKEANYDQTELYFEDPIITISRPREIIQTKVNGLDGDIIEIVSNGNFQINILFTLSGDRFWTYDNISLINLREFCKLKTEINIESPYLNDIFQIDKIVILDHKVAQSTEFSNITAIEINAVSVLNEEIFKINI